MKGWAMWFADRQCKWKLYELAEICPSGVEGTFALFDEILTVLKALPLRNSSCPCCLAWLRCTSFQSSDYPIMPSSGWRTGKSPYRPCQLPNISISECLLLEPCLIQYSCVFCNELFISSFVCTTCDLGHCLWGLQRHRELPDKCIYHETVSMTMTC